MRYAIYALLILFGLIGFGLGASVFGSALNAVHEIEALIMSLIGAVCFGSLGVIMAIEHHSSRQLAASVARRKEESRAA
jgi:hypothetical protein